MAKKEQPVTPLPEVPSGRPAIGSVNIAISFDLYTDRLFKDICSRMGDVTQSWVLNDLMFKINTRLAFKNYQEYLEKYSIIFADSSQHKNFWLQPQEITILDELTKKSGQNTKSKFVRSLIQFYAYLYDIKDKILLEKEPS